MEKIGNENTKFDALGSILPGREEWRIKVRVIRMWKVPGFLNPSETNSIEMVLVEKILVMCWLILMTMSIWSAEKEYIRDWKITKMILVELTDHSGKIECALFCFLGRKCRFKTSLILLARLFVNPNITEAEVFKNRFCPSAVQI
ncbi:unnamed protein product [Trifolium pratense]|uniref:Uncharacterized protein n=1 Tax=Trifolium pratense TaxID=57577 RepID=A0ACB0JER9_TRIPR|nr:unnamed protein product [Trifolium pratense]